MILQVISKLTGSSFRILPLREEGAIRQKLDEA